VRDSPQESHDDARARASIERCAQTCGEWILDPSIGFAIPSLVVLRAHVQCTRLDRAAPIVRNSTDSAPKLDAALPHRSGPARTTRAPRRRDTGASRNARAPRPIVPTRAKALEQLWRRYARRPDDEARNQLVERYQSFLEEVVRRFAQRLPRNVDRGDLATAANFGLISAIEGFDASRGVRFEVYCEWRVRGALLDELRNQDWLPRPWRARIEAHKRAVERLRSTLAREPDDAEVAKELALPITEYRQLFGFGLPMAPAGGMRAGDDDSDGPPGLEIVPDDSCADTEDKPTRDEILRLVAQKLTVQEYRLVYLKYWEELSMREIGELMHVSESRVCKMHQRLIERLKDSLHGNAAE
jgi:RNA polymerase sigma factor for flagellar operon FliA